jgi:hypothetical protein
MVEEYGTRERRGRRKRRRSIMKEYIEVAQRTHKRRGRGGAK